eukprot:4698061-Pleurochrysis_carterae.AAC.1
MGLTQRRYYGTLLLYLATCVDPTALQCSACGHGVASVTSPGWSGCAGCGAASVGRHSLAIGGRPGQGGDVDRKDSYSRLEIR